MAVGVLVAGARCPTVVVAVVLVVAIVLVMVLGIVVVVVGIEVSFEAEKRGPGRVGHDHYEKYK